MTSNLIQNYITTKPTSAMNRQPIKKQEAPKKPMPDFDIQKELDNRTFIKPLTGKGRLINGNIFNAPLLFAQDIVYDAKALKHAVSGKANDHELGKLNDLGLLLGGLGIAGYLFTKKQTPVTKGMEFIGLASFLGAMAIWPKIAIQLPAYLIHGVNVQKQYEDSFGRRKPFYQDPQFLPWDLYTDKEIDKMGDRMGVPKNIPNRREFIQEKMKKIAVQNNTLWMLTAGFATPIMSGLICNLTEPYLSKYFDKKNNKSADKIINNINEYSKKYEYTSVEKELEKILGNNLNKKLTPELEEQITSVISKYINPITAKNIEKDLKEKVFGEPVYKIQDDSIKEVIGNLNTVFKKRIPGADEEFLKTVIPDENSIINALKNSELYDKDLSKTQFSSIRQVILDLVSKNVIEYNKTHPDKSKDLKLARTLVMSNMTKNKDSNPVNIILQKVKSNVLNKDAVEKLKNVVKILDSFNAQKFTLDEYALKKVGAAPETVIANYWNDVASDLVKILGFTDKEIARTRIDRTLMSDLLREKLDNIAADKSSYEKVISKLVNKISEINNKINTQDMSVEILNGNSKQSTYDNTVDKIFNDTADKLRKAGFENTAKAIAGADANDSLGTLKNIQKMYVKDRLLGVKSSFYRIINTLDLYRRIATGANNIPYLNGRYIEVQEELIELCKNITLKGHSSDYAIKFYMLRNANPDRTVGSIKIENGKVVYQYFGKATQTVDIPSDSNFYKDAMKIMYSGEMHPDTIAALKEYSIKPEVINYRNKMLEIMGKEQYFAKPFHMLGDQTLNTPSNIKFLTTGIAPDELLFKSCQPIYNSKKWIKIFGGFGAALLGVTILAQFLFGKMKTPETTGKKK